jgi:hypothetical protein
MKPAIVPILACLALCMLYIFWQFTVNLNCLWVPLKESEMMVWIDQDSLAEFCNDTFKNPHWALRSVLGAFLPHVSPLCSSLLFILTSVNYFPFIASGNSVTGWKESAFDKIGSQICSRPTPNAICLSRFPYRNLRLAQSLHVSPPYVQFDLMLSVRWCGSYLWPDFAR